MKLGPLEIGLILVIILVVFGVGKLPDVGKQLGKGIRDFKKYSAGTEDEAAVSVAGATTSQSQAELDLANAKLEAAEAKLKLMEQSSKKAS
jgi:sec-independent protein translocase protein TatA